jgi:hypothetical protein
MDQDKPSFEKDVRPMFTQTDVEHMQNLGIDLSSRGDVEKHAAAIYETVTSGAMPPPGTGERWTAEMCERFKRWRDGGCSA